MVATLKKVNPLVEESTLEARGNHKLIDQCFYKITNHDELFKIGNTFLTDFNKGVKNFAFTSTGYKNSQQRTILALACFFENIHHRKVLIISDHLYLGTFKEFLEASEPKTKDLFDLYSFHHHFDFVDYMSLISSFEKKSVSEMDKIFQSFVDGYDIVLWDVPENEKLMKYPQFYFKIAKYFESLTVIVAQDASVTRQIESLEKFYKNYNINLKGVLLDTSSISKPPRKKKFFGIF